MLFKFKKFSRRALTNIISDKYILLLMLIFLILSITNIQRGKYLIGWDNLQVELNYWLNLKRNIWAAWQEYQGLGLLSGHAHAVESIRLILMLPIYLLLPNWLFRYTFHLLMLLIGVLSTYIFIKNTLLNKKRDLSVFAFVGALFYMLNWGTIQNFYQPLEPFSIFFAFFPFSLIFIIKFLGKRSYKNGLYLFIAYILIGLASHIETFTVVYTIAVFIPLLAYAVFSLLKKNIKGTINVVIILFLYVVANFYWLGTAFYFFLTNKDVRYLSVSNKLSTEYAFLQNVKYGDSLNVMQLKGFWFGNVDYFNDENKFNYMYITWINFINKYHPNLFAYLFFVIIVIGVFYVLFYRQKYRFLIVWLFGISIFFLMNLNGISGILFAFLREMSPTFAEIFRFPFTKWITVASFSFSVLLSFGVLAIYLSLENLKIRIFSRKNSGKRATDLLNLKYFVSGLVVVMILFYSALSFRGQFFYDNLEQKIPPSYFKMFKFFKNEPANGRIANLPQNHIWGWQFYNWGYRGSGFIWYGIEQPILDRAFDPWNLSNEQYYNELSYAIYSEDANLLQYLVNKYDIRYFLIDKNIIAPRAEKSLFFKESENLVKTLYKSEKVFDTKDLLVYKVANKSKDFVEISNNYVSSNKYDWGKYDSNAIYKDVLIYDENNIPDRYYPFMNDEKIANENYTINKKGYKTINLPNISYLESLPYRITKSSDGININYLGPEIVDRDGNKVFSANVNLNVIVGGDYFLANDIYVNDQVGSVVLGNSTLKITGFSSNQIGHFNFSNKVFSANVTDCYGNTTNFGKSFDKYPGSVSILSKNGSTCLNFDTIMRFDKPVVYKVSFDVKRDGDAVPKFCLYNFNAKKCINNEKKRIHASSEQFTHFIEYVYSDSTKPITFHLSNESFNVKVPQKITFKNINVSVYEVVDKKDVNLVGSAFENSTVDLSSYKMPLTVQLPKSYYEKYSYLPGTDWFYSTSKNCDTFNKGYYDRVLSRDEKGVYYEYKSLDATSCDSIKATNLNLNSGYIIDFVNKNVEGRNFEICLASNDLEKCLLRNETSKNGSAFVLPEYKNLKNNIDINIRNQSIGRIPTTNKLYRVDVKSIPYKWLKSIYLSNYDDHIKVLNLGASVDADVRKDTYYKYNVRVSGEQSFSRELVVLNQSYDNLWLMYDNAKCIFNIKSVFTCYKVKEHVLAKNWANGWVVPSKDATYTIVFVPQYLQYLGYILAMGMFVLIAIFSFKNKR